MAKTPKTDDTNKPSQLSATELERYVPSKDVDDAFGRPHKVDIEVLRDLKYAFLIGCTNKEAANYAGISEATFYNFCNSMEEQEKADFLELVERWKNDTVLQARQTLRSGIKNISTATWFLERKRKDEFATRTQNEQKAVTEFDEVDDEELEKIVNAGLNAGQSSAGTSETPQP